MINPIHTVGLLGFVAIGLALGSSTAAAAQTHPFTAKDLVLLDRVSDPHISPDGTEIVYDLRSTDWTANKGVHSIWLVDGAGKSPPRRLTASDGGATSPRWSADGKRIYFLSSRSGSAQIWSTAPAESEARQVTNLPLEIGSFRVSPDGTRIILSLAVFPDCADIACTKARLDAKKASKASGVLFERTFIRHWDDWADGTRNHLFAVKLDAAGVVTGSPVDLMRGFDGDAPSKPFGDDKDFAVTPDGKTVVFSAKQAGRTEAWSTNFDLWRTLIDGSKAPESLTTANRGADEQPVVSPDGSKVAWRAQKRATVESDRDAVMVMDLESGATREVAPDFDRSAVQIAWSADGKALYALAVDSGQVRLFAIDAASGMVRPLTGDGHVGDFDAGKNGLVFVHDALDSPGQLFHVGGEGGKPDPLTHHNAERLADLSFGAYEQFSFAGWNGETVHGYVVKPAGFQAGRKYPVAFLIHGGPEASMGNLFHYRWNAETFSGAGFAVVMIDFHGTPGYGQAFTDSIVHHWGDRPFEDLQKGWAAALARYDFLDGGRACALGGSYGGFMVNWIAGNWNGPWKCLVNHDGIFDNRIMGYSTEELWFSEWENGGLPWEHPQDYEQFNPANHVAAWTKPELVIHSANDFRIPVEQAIATFTALQRKGVPSQFLYFPDENHWVLKPQNSIQWHDTVFAWLKKWTANAVN